VRLGRVEATQLSVRPNLPVVGRRLARTCPRCARRWRPDFRELETGEFEVADTSSVREVLVERLEKDGWAIAADEGVTVAIDTALDDALLTEAACTRQPTWSTRCARTPGSR